MKRFGTRLLKAIDERFTKQRKDVAVTVVRYPVSAPNCNATPERFVKLMTEECLDPVIILDIA